MPLRNKSKSRSRSRSHKGGRGEDNDEPIIGNGSDATEGSASSGGNGDLPGPDNENFAMIGGRRGGRRGGRSGRRGGRSSGRSDKGGRSRSGDGGRSGSSKGGRSRSDGGSSTKSRRRNAKGGFVGLVQDALVPLGLLWMQNRSKNKKGHKLMGGKRHKTRKTKGGDDIA